MNIYTSMQSSLKIHEKILCIPLHCGYYYACYISSKYPRKVVKRKCLRFKHKSKRPKLHLSYFAKKMLEDC